MSKNDIGIGVEGPKGTCDDVNCPWHGRLNVRGRVFECTVASSKSHATAIVERGYHHLVPKYQSYERRKSRMLAHNPPCIAAKEGDSVMIAECRPISKTKHFVVVSKTAREAKE